MKLKSLFQFILVFLLTIYTGPLLRMIIKTDQIILTSIIVLTTVWIIYFIFKLKTVNTKEVPTWLAVLVFIGFLGTSYFISVKYL